MWDITRPGATSLEQQIALMHKYNYDCYMMGGRQAGVHLLPITTCWSGAADGPDFEVRVWSNILCALRGDPWHAALDRYWREHEQLNRHT